MKSSKVTISLAAFVCLVSFFYSRSRAEETPFTIGMGCDTVYLKTGVSLIWNETNLDFHDKYGVILVFGSDKKIEVIDLGDWGNSPKNLFTLDGIAIGSSKVDLEKRFGPPTKILPEEKFGHTYTEVWTIKDELLIVEIWQNDGTLDAPAVEKFRKDTVEDVTLRKAYF
jgi:hypothetical protein